MFQSQHLKLRINKKLFAVCLGLLIAFPFLDAADKTPSKPECKLLIPRKDNRFIHYSLLKVSRFKDDNQAQFNAYLTPSGAKISDQFRVKSVFIDKQPEVFLLQIHGWPEKVNGEADLVVTIHRDKDNFVFRFKKAVAVTQYHIDLVLLIDDSHSMRHIDPERRGVKAARIFAQMAADRGDVDTVSIISFRDKAEVLLKPTSSAKKEVIQEVIDNLNPGGQTDMDQALELAGGILDSLPGDKKIVLVVSDGRDSPGRYEDGHLFFQNKNRPIYTLGYSDLADLDILKKISKETGGRFLFNPTHSDLVNIFREIAPLPLRKVQIDEFKFDSKTSKKFPVDDTVKMLKVALDGKPVGKAVLISPSGTKHQIDNKVGSHSIEVYNPENGEWTIYSISRQNLLSITAESDLELFSFPLPEKVVADQKNEISCLMINGSKSFTGADIKAILTGPDGKESYCNLLESGEKINRSFGDGIYSNVFIPQSGGGLYKCKLIAKGLTSEKLPFQRIITFSFDVQPPLPVIKVLNNFPPVKIAKVTKEKVVTPVKPKTKKVKAAPIQKKAGISWVRLLIIIFLICAVFAFFIWWMLKKRNKIPEMSKYILISTAVHVLIFFLAMNLLVETGVVEIEEISPALAVKIKRLEKQIGFNLTPSGQEISLDERARDVNLEKEKAAKRDDEKEKATERPELDPEKSKMEAKLIKAQAEIMKVSPEVAKQQAEQSKLKEQLELEKAKFREKERKLELERKLKNSPKSELKSTDKKSSADSKPEEKKAEKRKTAKLELETAKPKTIDEKIAAAKKLALKQKQLEIKLSVKKHVNEKLTKKEKAIQTEIKRSETKKETVKKQLQKKPEIKKAQTVKPTEIKHQIKASVIQTQIESVKKNQKQILEVAPGKAQVKKEIRGKKSLKAQEISVSLRKLKDNEIKEFTQELPKPISKNPEVYASKTASMKNIIHKAELDNFKGSELTKKASQDKLKIKEKIDPVEVKKSEGKKVEQLPENISLKAADKIKMKEIKIASLTEFSQNTTQTEFKTAIKPKLEIGTKPSTVPDQGEWTKKEAVKQQELIEKAVIEVKKENKGTKTLQVKETFVASVYVKGTERKKINIEKPNSKNQIPQPANLKTAEFQSDIKLEEINNYDGSEIDKTSEKVSGVKDEIDSVSVKKDKARKRVLTPGRIAVEASRGPEVKEEKRSSLKNIKPESHPKLTATEVKALNTPVQKLEPEPIAGTTSEIRKPEIILAKIDPVNITVNTKKGVAESPRETTSEAKISVAKTVSDVQEREVRKSLKKKKDEAKITDLSGIKTDLSPEARKQDFKTKLSISGGGGGVPHATAIKIGLARYKGGDWDSSGSSMMYLAHQIEERTGMAIEASDKVVDISNPALTKLPFVYMTGHKNFVLTEKERKNLENYLKKGGYLWVDDSTAFGDNNFDSAFRREIKRVLPSTKLEKLDMEFPAFRTGYNLQEGYMGYRIPPGDKYRLDYIEGIKIDDRVAVVYTRNDYGDGLNIDPNTHPINPSLTDLSPAEMQEGAVRMGVNLVLYFLLNRAKIDKDFINRSSLTLGKQKHLKAEPLPKGQNIMLPLLSSKDGWTRETWGDELKFEIKKQELKIDFKLGKNKKIALTNNLPKAIRLTTKDTIALDVTSRLKGGARIAVGFDSGGEYYETKPFFLKPGLNKAFFKLDAKSFKSEKSKWKYNDSLKGTVELNKLSLLIYSPEAGKINIKKIRVIK